jgi:sulfite reductase (NADPH) flavoprotein alpha-component
MPDNAQALWDEISDDSAPSFANSYYSVLALGDTNYDGFCTAGILWDERLQALGAQRVTERVDCDVDYEEPANQWLNEALATIAQKGSSVAGDQQSSSVKKAAKSKFNRQNPLSAELITKKQLTQAGSSKETFHYEFSLAESGETYEAGDALNVVASNRDELVDELLALFNTSGDLVEPYKGESLTLTDIFTNILEIRTPSKELIAELALRSGDEKLASLVNDSNKEPLNNFLWGKDTTDLLKLYPQAQFSIAEFIALSKPLAARAYSISSW